MKNPLFLGEVLWTALSSMKLWASVPMNAPATAKTADYTVTTSDMGKILTNAGAAGVVVFTLPPAASCKNQAVKVCALAAQITRLLPRTGESVFWGGSGVASKYAQLAGVIGNYIEVFSDGTQWIVTNHSGVVTKEA